MRDNGVSPPRVPTDDGGRSAPLLEDLTAPQRQAVLHGEGPLLVLAAAGSGKTRVITRRIARLVGSGVPPWRILALTFTNKAAGEMRDRVTSLLQSQGRPVRGLTVTTFHSLSARLLRRYPEQAGVRPDFSIYDSSDQVALLKRVLESMSLSAGNWPPRSVLSAISDAKNKLLSAEEFGAGAGDYYSRTIAKVYAEYQRALRAANAVDFDDLLVLTARALRSSEQVREECRARWTYLLIDEYQDTNHAQFVMASMLAGDPAPGSAGPNICVVGDPDQAIYGWRGADIGNILEFEEHYPGCRVIALGENFRSTAPVLGAADALIRHNRRRKHKELFTRRPGGDKVEVVLCRDERHEATLVADWLRARHEHRGEGEGVEAGLAWRDMAVFYRTNALSRVVEDAMRTANIPYTIARGTAFYEREEVKNALAYLRVVANPADDVSLDRVVNVPARGLGATSMARIEAMAREQGVPVLEALRAVASGEQAGLTAKAIASAARFVEMVDGWTGAGSFLGEEVGGSLAGLVERVLQESGLEAMYRAQAQAGKTEADAERLDNLAELVSSARQFESEFDPAADPATSPAEDDPLASQVPPLLAMLRAYLESISLIADADAVDPDQGAVTLMTLHAAKGLEFGAVAMIGLEEGLLPHSRALDSEAQMEEERRLAFVGITRAMRRLLITSARYRTIRGLPERTISSRFIDELGGEHVTVSDQSDSRVASDGPGWEAAGDGAHEDAPRGRADPGGSRSAFPPGSRVRHPQFGVGTVRSVITGASARAVIEFGSVGVKTLVLEYARLQRIG